MLKDKVILELSEGSAELIDSDLISLEVIIYCSTNNCCCGNCMPNSYGNDHSKNVNFDRQDILKMAQIMNITLKELKQ